MFGRTSKKADDYYPLSNYQDYFILSDINASWLKKNKINMTVSDFKQIVRRSKPSAKVSTGSSHFNFRSTKVYKIQDFKEYQYD